MSHSRWCDFPSGPCDCGAHTHSTSRYELKRDSGGERVGPLEPNTKIKTGHTKKKSLPSIGEE